MTGSSGEDAIRASAAPAPAGAYPHARRSGNFLFLSGIGPRTADDEAPPGNVYNPLGTLVAHDIAAQMRQAFANVRAVLESAGAHFENLIDVTAFLTDIDNDFEKYNAVWAEYFPDPETAPCRTTVGVMALPAAVAIQLKCIARIRSS